jgi:DNA-binding winged helix-turn-helix (wHTH) protein/tetratricopeptide (TPR) repeat protein
VRKHDEWLLDPAELSLVNGSGSARLTRKAAAVLEALVRHRGEVVSQEQLRQTVWPELHVTPDLVREYIFDLRTILGDDARRPRLIETIRGRGYRLVGDIQLAEARGDVQPGPVRITVANLADRSLDARWQRLALGLGEDIATSLSRYPDVAMVPHLPISADTHHGDVRLLAKALDVTYIVTGSLMAFDGEVRVLVTLVDGRDGSIRWTREFRRPAHTLPEMIDEISGVLAGSLGGMHGEIIRLERSLVRRRNPDTLAAYEHYLLACDAELNWDEPSSMEALDHIERALALDRDFGRSWVVLGWLCERMAANRWHGEPADWDRRRDEAQRAAARCDPRDPMILSDLAGLRARDGDIRAAESLVIRAIDLIGNQADASAYLAEQALHISGRPEIALELVDRALALNADPPTWYGLQDLRSAFFAGDHDRCLAASEAAPDFRTKFVYRLLAAAALGRRDEASRYRQDLLARYPDFLADDYVREVGMVHPLTLRRFHEGIAHAMQMAAA